MDLFPPSAFDSGRSAFTGGTRNAGVRAFMTHCETTRGARRSWPLL